MDREGNDMEFTFRENKRKYVEQWKEGDSTCVSKDHASIIEIVPRISERCYDHSNRNTYAKIGILKENCHSRS